MRAVSLVFLAAALAACSKTTPPAHATQVKSRSELIGGKRALAEVGDFKISNGIVHAIVQDVGTSRGFGSFGGSLIDVDLVRGTQGSPAEAPKGNDYFTEMFPAFFLTAIEPSKVEVYKDGSDGGPAIIRVSGTSGTFLSLIKALTDVVDPKQKLDYTCDYILEPGKQYLKIVTTVSNPTSTDAAWSLAVPFGFVTLLGEGQRLFVPGQAGFDMRYHLEDTVYKRPASLNALPGEVTQMWTTEGDGVSYALAIGRNPDGTYLDGKPEYPTAKPDSMLIPIASSSFLGSYWAKAPTTLPPKGSYSYTAYLAVGSGDVASVQQVVYELRDTITRPNGREYVMREKTPYGWLSGTVRETTGAPLGGVSVVIQDEAGLYVSQATTNANGTWRAPVQPGKFRAYAVDKIRAVARSEELVEVAEGQSARIDLRMEQPGTLQVVVRDETGREVPAKISVEAVYDNDDGSRPPRRFLYDLKVGERIRPSDLRRDEAGNPDTRRYLERSFFAPHGAASQALKPGTYTVYASRGIEYDLPSQTVTITAGKTTDVGLTLTHVLKTPGWISGDFHVHSVKSVDSDMALTERVISYAVEGVDFLSSTDHNYVADYRPVIDALKLNDWVRSVVGLELTSLEMGHFNAFPLVVQPGPVQHGSFRWFYRPPGELFAQLRGLGVDPQKTIVQVNHPRDTILGYLNAFNYGTFVGEPIPPTSSIVLDTTPQPDGTPSPYHPSNFSMEFDAMEVFNGKRFDIMFNYRIPATPPEGPEPTIPNCPPGGPTTEECIPAPGEVLMDLAKVEEPGQPTRYIQQPAYPGAIDDWYTMLKQGRHITATGNSDSHGAKAEAGLPRTYIQADSGDGSMRALDETEVFDSLRQGAAYPTNGPIIEVFEVNGLGMGRTVVASDGVVDVKIVVKAAPWIDVKRVVVRRGGKDQGNSPEVLDVIPVPETTELERVNVTKRYTGIPDGSFLVLEVSGDRDMWPVHTPYEFPSLEISDAVGVIGGSFGFGNKHGKYKPQMAQKVTPYAFTNPIWVDRSLKQQLRPVKRVLPVSNDRPFTPRSMPDLRKLFHAFHSDPE